MTTRTCAECPATFSPRVPKQAFCSTGCRESFNRRRRDRGAELYDVFMSNKYDDDGAPKETLRGLVNAFRDSDAKQRAGKPSWQPWAVAQMALPKAYSEEGDKR